MMHLPIQFKNLCLSFPYKLCFADFSGQIHSGNRIAIIGRNGSGKSTLLQLLAGLILPSEGEVYVPSGLSIGYVPQTITELTALSGGQRFNKLLTQALGLIPDLLMLDEPTNHLDSSNRRSLIRMLEAFSGTLIMVTHDIELLRTTADTIWHIDGGKVNCFSGGYEDYMRELNIQRTALTQELSRLERQKKQLHVALMKEQTRAKCSRQIGEKHIQQQKWPTIVSAAKAGHAQKTSGRKKSVLNDKKQELTQKLTELYLEEVIQPKFNLNSTENNQTLVTVYNGSIGYEENQPLLTHLNFTIKAGERAVIQGNNGSGKSTLIKAITGDGSLIKKGEWMVPKSKDIGYLDQHYNTLAAENTVYDHISALLPKHSHAEVRKFLNDFLFRKNEEVNALVSTLSGGEKARLSLAQISALPPRLLIIDEVTNNLDRETRAHVIQVLKEYPGAMIVISHDIDFLQAINLTHWYEIKNGLLI